MIKRILLILIVAISLYSCKKEELGPQYLGETTTGSLSGNESVLVLNEGNFTWGNGSLSVYNKNDRTVAHNVFQQVNSLPLGDVPQSISTFNNKIYIVVDNSGKIEVVDRENLSLQVTITGFNSPRYFLPISASKAYVTELYNNSIYIVDLINNSISGNIAVSGWTEDIEMVNDTVYVVDRGNNNLLIVDPANDQLVDSVKLGESPNAMVKDKNNQLWVMCSGGSSVENARLFQFNPSNRLIVQSFTFSNIADSPGNLEINGNGDRLYFINTDVYTMSINASNLPSTKPGVKFIPFQVEPRIAVLSPISSGVTRLGSASSKCHKDTTGSWACGGSSDMGGLPILLMSKGSIRGCLSMLFAQIK